MEFGDKRISNNRNKDPALQKRQSEQFVYNPNQQWHIGKRTGNQFRRIKPKQNFDGFPRFSQYQSHHVSDYSSLAKQSEIKQPLSPLNAPQKLKIAQNQQYSDNKKQSANQKPSLPQNPSQPEPAVIPLSPIRSVTAPLQSNPFTFMNLFQLPISTIKRKYDSIRKSQINHYKKLVQNMEEKWKDQFVFDEQQPKNKDKRVEEQVQQKENLNKNENKNEIQREQEKQMIKQKEREKQRFNKMQKNKKNQKNSFQLKYQQQKIKKKNRVSFKQNPVMQNFSYSDVKNFDQTPQQNDKQDFQEHRNEIKTVWQPDQYQLKQNKQQQNNCLRNQVKQEESDKFQFVDPSHALQQTEKKCQQNKTQRYINYEDNYQRPPSSRFQNVQKQKQDDKKSSDYEKLNKRQKKRKKQRITDIQTKPQQKSKLKRSKSNNSKKNPRKPSKSKKQNSPTRNEHSRSPEQVSQSQPQSLPQPPYLPSSKSHKIRLHATESHPSPLPIALTHLQSSFQSISNPAHSNPCNPQRYPRRIRVKPVQYWKNQKVHYHAGKAVKLEISSHLASLTLKDLLKIQENFPCKIQIDFHSKDVKVEIQIPPKKGIKSLGLGDGYEKVQIQIGEEVARRNKNNEKIKSKDQRQHSKNEQNDQTQNIDENQVYFDDGLRSIKMKVGQKIQVTSFTYFQISNREMRSVCLVMKIFASA